MSKLLDKLVKKIERLPNLMQYDPTDSWVNFREIKGNKVALFIPGTIGSLKRTFHDDFIKNKIIGHYDSIIGYDHPTLSMTPEQNADMLMQSLKYFKDIEIDIYCSSRGHLVARYIYTKSANVMNIVSFAGNFNGTNFIDILEKKVVKRMLKESSLPWSIKQALKVLLLLNGKFVSRIKRLPGISHQAIGYSPEVPIEVCSNTFVGKFDTDTKTPYIMESNKKFVEMATNELLSNLKNIKINLGLFKVSARKLFKRSTVKNIVECLVYDDLPKFQDYVFEGEGNDLVVPSTPQIMLSDNYVEFPALHGYLIDYLTHTNIKVVARNS